MDGLQPMRHVKKNASRARNPNDPYLNTHAGNVHLEPLFHKKRGRSLLKRQPNDSPTQLGKDDPELQRANR